MRKHTAWFGLFVCLLICLLACSLTGVALTGVAHGEPAWTTYHRDPARSGDDPDATQPVAPALAWQTENLGAPIWGQPLVLGAHVYVATVGDEIYELNATTGAVEWQQSAGTPVPSGELPCGDITPTVGIVGTPVIDTSTGAIYAVADTWDASTREAQHMLKGYRLSDGEQILSVPVDPPGSDPKALLQRTALNLDQGNVVFGFGGNDGDCSDYRGTVVAVPLAGGAPRFWQVPIAKPSEWGGAVWAPSGPAVDNEGNIYATTGNPDPPAGERATTYDYSDSVVKLGLAQDFVTDPATEHTPTPLGFFEPPNWEEESNTDLDLSSAGAEPLPDGLLFQAGKDGRGYLIDEASMGSGAAAVYSGRVCGGDGSFGGDAYASGVIYIPCTNGVQALAYDEAAPTFTPLWQGPEDAFGSPILSGGSVWVVATGGFDGGGTTLYGLDPSTGAPRYTETLPSPVSDHFASPSADGVPDRAAPTECCLTQPADAHIQGGRKSLARADVAAQTPARGQTGSGASDAALRHDERHMRQGHGHADRRDRRGPARRQASHTPDRRDHARTGTFWTSPPGRFHRRAATEAQCRGAPAAPRRQARRTRRDRLSREPGSAGGSGATVDTAREQSGRSGDRDRSPVPATPGLRASPTSSLCVWSANTSSSAFAAGTLRGRTPAARPTLDTRSSVPARGPIAWRSPRAAVGRSC
jgi:outer membrane protein assembly factor BamB